MTGSGVVSALLRKWGNGDAQAGDDLLQLVYRELRRRAAGYLRGERPGHTLQPTALVHEAYMRLAGLDRMTWQNRAQFFGMAARSMRRILVEHARAHRAAKRPPAALQLELHDGMGATEPRSCDLLLLDQALGELSDLDSTQARIVELRYFGGLSEREAAEVLGISRSTVTREWHTARAWLYRRMTQGNLSDG